MGVLVHQVSDVCDELSMEARKQLEVVASEKRKKEEFESDPLFYYQEE